MKKQKILFVISNLKCGGAEHALVALLNEMDYKKYDVDLLVIRTASMFYNNMIPPEVNLISLSSHQKAILEPSLKNALDSFLHAHFIRAFKYIGFWLKKDERKKNATFFWSDYWEKNSKNVESIEKGYDVAIGWLEGISIYFCVDKVLANRKIGWIHTNYLDSNQNKEMDERYFEKLDYLVTISYPSTETLKQVFPEYENKIHTIYNILDYHNVLNLAEEKVTDLNNNFEGITIVSVGNVLPVKGYDLAIKVCEKLIRMGEKVRWIVVGRKDNADILEKEIIEKGLENSFFMIGMRNNPYKYMKLADLYVQCSRYEGYSTTVREAKLLLKPIVATKCQGISDQLSDQENGTLVDGNEDSILAGILDLIHNPQKREKYIESLTNDKSIYIENKNRMKELYELLDK